MHPLRREMLAGGGDILRRDPDPRAALYGADPVESALRRHHHPAARDLEVGRLVASVPAVLPQYTLSRNTGGRGAILHVRRHIGGANDDHGNAGTIRAEYQLARSLRIVGGHNAPGRGGGDALVIYRP